MLVLLLGNEKTTMQVALASPKVQHQGNRPGLNEGDLIIACCPFRDGDGSGQQKLDTKCGVWKGCRWSGDLYCDEARRERKKTQGLGPWVDDERRFAVELHR